MYKTATYTDPAEILREVTQWVKTEGAESSAKRADTLEVWGSSFDDPGPDYCKYILRKGGVIIAEYRVEGY